MKELGVVDMNQELKKFDGDVVYSYADLTAPDWQTKCEGVKPNEKELALSDEEFGQHFKSPKVMFACFYRFSTINNLECRENQ